MREAEAGASARDIARRIQFMTGVLRKAVRRQKSGDIMRAARDAAGALRDAPAGGAPGPEAPGQQGAPGKAEKPAREPGWWVLAQGRLLDPDDFDARELARQDLLESVLKAGVLPAENVWVWDETGRAQLVLATLPTRERALRVAERLRDKGLSVAVRREMP